MNQILSYTSTFSIVLGFRLIYCVVFKAIFNINVFQLYCTSAPINTFLEFF